MAMCQTKFNMVLFKLDVFIGFVSSGSVSILFKCDLQVIQVDSILWHRLG